MWSKGVEPPLKRHPPRHPPSNRAKFSDPLFVSPPLLAISWRFQFPEISDFFGGDPPCQSKIFLGIPIFFQNIQEFTKIMQKLDLKQSFSQNKVDSSPPVAEPLWKTRVSPPPGGGDNLGPPLVAPPPCRRNPVENPVL